MFRLLKEGEIIPYNAQFWNDRSLTWCNYSDHLIHCRAIGRPHSGSRNALLARVQC
jgi:hypothetical protein